MYLSLLKLDPLKHNTRKLHLSHYLLHQAVFRAFPDEVNGGAGRILYRLDIDRQGNTSLLVQSEKEPDWGRANMLNESLVEPVAIRPLSFNFKTGQKLYFRLRANPTIKRATPEEPDKTRRQGLIKENDQVEWLRRKSEVGGFTVLSCQINPEGIFHDEKGGSGAKLRHYAVLFEGVLKVTNPEAFLDTINNGIGSAKGFGFGLLSIAPVRG